VMVLLLGAATPVAGNSTSPVYRGDFPDPYVLNAGGTYWAYATGTAGLNLQVMRSPDLATWSAVSDPLPVLPGWAAVGNTWAPGVVQRAGGYLMYYTVRHTASGRQCISVATSTTPSGPFRDTSTAPFICQLDHSGSIDPVPFVSPGGSLYLLWKSDDNAVGQPTHLWGQRLSSDGRSLSGSPRLLLTQSAGWQAPVIEGPAMVAYGGTYYLFYGAGAWDRSSAAMGYAVCSSPVGPCQNASGAGPWMASHGQAIGPSGPTFFTGNDGVSRIAYHAWMPAAGYPNGGVRTLWVDTLGFRRT